MAIRLADADTSLPEFTDLTKPTEECLDTLVGWYEAFEDACGDNADLAQRDRDFYDGNQWTSSEIAELKKRGQPVITVNRIARKVNYILGSEIRTRVDPEAFPRTPHHHDEAIAITDAMRYVTDVEKFDRVRSRLLENMAIEGYGGVVVETDVTGEGEDQDIDVKLRYVPWNRLWYDPHSAEEDFSDARYKGIWIWMDLEEALLRYPKGKQALEEAWNSTNRDMTFGEDRPTVWCDKERHRVRVSEIYYLCKGKWYVAHYTKGGFLIDPALCPYLNERRESICPLEMQSALVDRENQRYGIVRGMISPQEEINKRRSKSLHALSVRQLIAERGTIINPHTVQTELAKPDGFVEVESGAISQQRIIIEKNQELAMGHLQMLGEAKAEIDGVGPASSALADDSRVRSGRAEIALQQAAAMELEPLFDAMRSWQHRVLEQIWWRIRQFWTYEKWFRVRDDKERSGYRFVGINRPMTRAARAQEMIKAGAPPISAMEQAGFPEPQAAIMQMGMMLALQAQQSGQQIPPQAIEQQAVMLLMNSPVGREMITYNDISRLGVDIVMSTAPDTTVIEQEEFEKVSAIFPAISTAAPQLVPEFVRILIQASQLREKRKLLEMLDKPQGPDPQTLALQQQTMQLQMAQMAANVSKTQAQAQNESVKAQVAAQKLGPEITNLNADSMHKAAQAGERSGGGLQSMAQMAPPPQMEAGPAGALPAEVPAEEEGMVPGNTLPMV